MGNELIHVEAQNVSLALKLRYCRLEIKSIVLNARSTILGILGIFNPRLLITFYQIQLYFNPAVPAPACFGLIGISRVFRTKADGFDIG